MKKLLTLILAAGFYAMQGQEPLPATNQGPCSPTGVTTNPNNPQNPIPGHADFINWFDWTNSDYRTLYDNDNTGYIRNPYFLPAGATSTFYDNPDYKPEDGWELLYVDLGVDRNGNWKSKFKNNK